MIEIYPMYEQNLGNQHSLVSCAFVGSRWVLIQNYSRLCAATDKRKTTRLNSGWGFGQTNSPLSTARILIDDVGLCLLTVSEVWWLFAPDLRRWINSFSGSDFKPRLVYKTWYFVIISLQTLTCSFRQSNCIHCDKNLSLYCHQNIFCSVAAKG